MATECVRDGLPRPARITMAGTRTRISGHSCLHRVFPFTGNTAKKKRPGDFVDVGLSRPGRLNQQAISN